MAGPAIHLIGNRKHDIGLRRQDIACRVIGLEAHHRIEILFAGIILGHDRDAVSGEATVRGIPGECLGRVRRTGHRRAGQAFVQAGSTPYRAFA